MEADPEKADVERRGEDDRADLPGRPEVGADRRKSAEDRGREQAAAE